MIDLENINDVEKLTEQELQYHIYRLFTQLARSKNKVKECEQTLSMLNLAFYKYKR